MKRLLAFVLLFSMASAGCSSTYHYFTDPTANLEATRYNYVKYHPTAKHNNDIISGRIRYGMSTEEVNASWGTPTAVIPGDRPGVSEVWAYQDPDDSHGNQMWLLRFSNNGLQNVEKVNGMRLADMQRNATVPNPADVVRPGPAEKPYR